MTKCLDCGYLCPMLEGKDEDIELPQIERVKLSEAISQIAGVQYRFKGKAHPCHLGCFLRVADFPGEPYRRDTERWASWQPGILLAPDSGTGRRYGSPQELRGQKRAEKEENEKGQAVKNMLEALTKDWDCAHFFQHIPGRKPSVHSDLQDRRSWEVQQEEARRAWETQQEEARITREKTEHEANQRFQEELMERQKEHESGQRRRDRLISILAFVIPLVVSLLMSLLT